MRLDPSPNNIIMYNVPSVAASFNSDEFPEGASWFTTFGIQVIVANQSSANFSAIVQGSCDGVTWGDYGTAQAITANGSYMFNVTGFGWPKLRIAVTRSAGSADFKILGFGKQG